MMLRMSMKMMLTGALALAMAACAPKQEIKPEVEARNVATTMAPAALFADYDVVDLSVTVAENMPAHWGTSPAFQRWTYNWFAQEKDQHGNDYFTHEGPYFGQRYVIDEHTGTQSDFPAHFIPPAKSGLPEASEMGEITGEKYPLERMMGPAVVIDASDIRDKAEAGKSPVITLERVKQWEAQNGPVKAGEVVLFRSGYSDAYYKPMPEGMRMTFQPVVTKTAPGWPAPEPAVMEYLHGKGVWHLGTDGPSMGPCEGGQAVHVAGLKHGMSWEEMLTNMGKLPARGAFYVALGVKVRGQSGAISRAVAFAPRKTN